MNKKINWQKWAIFTVAVLLPAAIIGLSNYEIFPDVRLKMGLLLLITVGASLIMIQLADEPVDSIRQPGIALEIAMALSLYAGVVCHMGYARDLSASKQGRTEKHEEEDRQAALQREAAEAEAKRLAALRSVLVQTPMRDRGKVLPPASKQSPTAQPTASPAPALSNPDTVRAEWNPYLLYTLMLEAFLAIVAASVVLAMRSWDGNSNGVPDWIEKLSEGEIVSRFPQYHATLFPKAEPQNPKS